MAELQGGCPEEGTVSREVGFVQVATRWDARWGLKAGKAACVEVLGGEGRSATAPSRDGLRSTEEQWAENKQEAPADHVMPSTEWGAGGEKSGAPLRSLFRQMGERPMRINVEKSAKRYEGGGRAS